MSDVNGKTESQLNKEGYYVSQVTGEVKDKWGHGQNSEISPQTGKAEPKK